jgi:3'-5' exoribonuclease
MSKSVFVSSLVKDSDILDFFMVKSAAIKVGSNHKMYYDVNLGDRTGEINGKKWDVGDDDVAVLNDIKEGDIVRIKGACLEWNGVRQIRIAKIRKAAQSDGIDLNDFIKAAPEKPEKMYAFILEQAEAIGDPELRKMAEAFLTANRERLLYYPAAMKNHHAELGGLLYHIKRMLMMGLRACEVYTELDKDWLVCGVILHDMEKLNELDSNEMGISPGYTFEGKLLGHIAQGVKAVEKLAEETGLSREKAIMLEHMILSHHYEPEFGSPVKPLFQEAEMLHYLDMVDAKMFDFADALEQVEPGSFSERVRTLDGRTLYKPSFRK